METPRGVSYRSCADNKKSARWEANDGMKVGGLYLSRLNKEKEYSDEREGRETHTWRADGENEKKMG